MASDQTADAVSPLSVVCGFWREFDLESRRPHLDELGLKIADHQEDAQQNRRRLAEATKEFKRMCALPSAGTEGVSRSATTLMKQYQEEVDRQTRRAKHAESAFLELYQTLYEAPDPAPALTLAFETASRVTELEVANRKLGAELADYRAEAASIRNQDLTIRKLEEKMRVMEAELEAKNDELVEVQQRAVAEVDAARLSAMQQRESELSQALADANASLATMQRLHAATQNQLFAYQSRSEEEREGRQSELELATVELERVEERLSALEREKAALEERLTAVRDSPATPPSVSSGGAGGGSSVEDTLRQELGLARELAGRLRSELASCQARLEESSSMWEARVAGLRGSLTASEQHAAAVEAELAMRPTNLQMEELRQQLRVLQAVGYNAIEELDSGANGAADGANGHGPTSTLGTSLESLLMGKNRHLEHELTMTRLKVAELGGELEAQAASISELSQQLEDKQALIERLEEDLMAVRREAAAAGKTQGSSGPGTPGNRDDDGGDGGDGQTSMVRVLVAQRDRFRHRSHELEEELNKCRLELQSAKSEHAACKADNIALIERLKYVGAYKQQQKHGGAAGDVEGGGAEVEKRYTRMYEDGLNPFKEFQGAQKERTRKQMGVPDKVMYMFGQAVFGSKSARLFTFCYLAALHLLIFVLLMRFSHHSSSALYQHTQAVMDSARHEVTAAMHIDGASAVAEANTAGLLARRGGAFASDPH